MEEKLKQTNKDFQGKIQEAQTLKELDDIFLALFGKSGEITLIPREFGSLPKEEVAKISPLFNQTKASLEELINLKREEIKEIFYSKLVEEKVDLTKVTENQLPKGNLHPLTVFEKEIRDLFSKIGFQQFDAPHIDSDFYNFEVLNIPQGHPARDLWDTLYLDPGKSGIEPGKLLLRTHTSNSQIRIMKENKLPIRMMNMGRCFRYENVDARHNHTFEQFELVYIDKGVNMTHLQFLSEYFLKAVFGKDIKARLRPKYYPFVEPGAGVDGLCLFCKGKGCKICGFTGWLELAGAGMIHPQVLKNGGIDPSEYSGIAWGFGPERMIMLRYGISDLRLFNSGDLRFLKEVGNAGK